MRQSNLTRFSFFIPVLLIAVLFVYSNTRIVAQNQGPKLPNCIQELLSGETTDVSGVLSQLSEKDLPAALASIELLKFKALHNEISLTSKDVSTLKKLITNRIDKSSTVSFSETDTCKQKVAEVQISFDGQNVSVPQYFIADENLSIIACTPNREAGSIFPEFTVEFFSKSALKKQSLTIDGKEYPTYQLVTKDSPLIFSPDIIPNNMLAIGTHTAKINIANKDSETVSKEWQFTVGIYDTPTPPLPDSAVVVKELDINPEKFLPKQKLNGKLSVIVYRDKNGKIYTEYKLKTSTGQVIKSRNLAFIRRRATTKKDLLNKIDLYPMTSRAFKGNTLNTSYEWKGEGAVVEEKWENYVGQVPVQGTNIKVTDNVHIWLELTIKVSYIDDNGDQQSYTYGDSANKTIQQFDIVTRFYNDRQLLISNESSTAFDINGSVQGTEEYDLAEGKEYSYDYGGVATLKVDRLRWKTLSSEGAFTIQNSLASSTKIIFTKPGYAELGFDVSLTWRQFGETYKSEFKPDASVLCAFYPVTAKAKFTKYPKGQLPVTSRHIIVDSFEFEIKQQKRILTSPNDYELSKPIQICKSSFWPASSPIEIKKASIFLGEGKYDLSLTNAGPFTYVTPFSLSNDVTVNISGLFEFNDFDASRLVITALPIIPIYEDVEVLKLKIDPSENVTIPEGKDTEFTATVLPVDGMGTGAYSETDSSLNILDGYTVGSVDYIFWYEEPMGSEDDWKKKALKTVDYSHIFDPILGSGSYDLHCGFVMKLREPDTGEDASVYIENKVPVEVTPGLHIFSPFETMIYPLYGKLRVDTSLDSEENLPDWQKITWKLNGKDYKPDTAAPHFFIELDHTGDWTLEAELKKKDPITGEDMILKDSVEFSVKPIDIRLSPSRKLIDFSKSKSQILSLSIAIDSNTAEKPGDHLPWDGDFIEAVVDKVEWSVVDDGSATPAKNFTSLDTKPDSFDAVLNFTNTGAATVQASVTIKLVGAEKLFLKKYPKYKYEFVLPVFNLPAVRTDVWAKNPPEWHNFNGKTADRAIQNTTRLFSADSGEVEFDGKNYDWNKTDDFGGKIKLSTALSGGVPLTSTNLKFSWEGPDGQTSEETEFKPSFSSTGAPEVVMNSSIEFGSGNSFGFNPVKTPVEVKPLSKVINCSVTANPANVKVNAPSTVSFKFGEITGVIDSQTQLDVWDGEYNIKLDKVSWKANDASLQDSKPTIQFSGSSHGEYIISAKPEFSVKPINCEEMQMGLDATNTIINVVGNFMSWKVDRYCPDHLDKIRNAYQFGTDIYTLSEHQIWTKDDFFPLVVGCNSEVVLIPEFSDFDKNKNIKVSYQWLYALNEDIAIEGKVDLSDKITIPTPPYIAKYKLKLQLTGFSDVATIPEVYVVKKITEESAFLKPFYIRGVDDSVLALTGSNLATINEKLVNNFYDWWWSDSNELKYFEDAHSAIEVIQNGGGMCAGLADYFAMCLQCQGIEGVDRFTVMLNDTPIPNDYIIQNAYNSESNEKSNYPQNTEYWGAVVYKDHGLHCEKANKPLPRKISNSYIFSKVKMYKDNTRPIPYSGGINTMIVCDGLYSQLDKNFTCPDVYVFVAPNDGHVIVRYRTKNSTHMYDPSFGEGEFSGKLDNFTDTQYAKTVVKDFNSLEANMPEMWNYFKSSVGWLRGSVPFASTEFEYGISVFDIPMESVNFLEVRTSYYENLYETYK